MAVGEVGLRDWWKVLRREIGSGAWLGIILGVIGVVLWGSVTGSMLPFLLRRCGLDPATSSAPFVTTLVDVTGLLIYFNVALVVLRGTVL